MVERYRLTTYPADEVYNRAPHLLNKQGLTPEGHLLRWKWTKCIEAGVIEWFRERWPQQYLPPTNHGQFDRPAPDDFRIRTPDKIWHVDVAGPWQSHPSNPTGKDRWGVTSSRKEVTDLHLCARPVDWTGGEIVGWQPGVVFRTASQRPWPLETFIGWLDAAVADWTHWPWPEGYEPLT